LLLPLPLIELAVEGEVLLLLLLLLPGVVEDGDDPGVLDVVVVEVAVEVAGTITGTMASASSRKSSSSRSIEGSCSVESCDSVSATAFEIWRTTLGTRKQLIANTRA